MNKASVNIDDIKVKLLENDGFKEEYDKFIPRYEVVSQIIEARKTMHISQEELALKAGKKNKIFQDLKVVHIIHH